MMLLFRKLVLK
jgi:hypothetical protein